MSSKVKSLAARRSHVADWELTQKPRVWKGQFRLIVIVLLTLTTYLALPATIYFTALLILDPQGGWQPWAIGSLITFASTLVLGAVLSASTKCSLCHGSPLMGKQCRKHVLANKLPFLTYRASAMLHILFTGKFRCMFCSTPFRLGTRSESSSNFRREF